MLLVDRGTVSPTDTMRDGELVPFAPFSRTLFGMLPIMFVTRSECCNDLFLTGTLGARASVCLDQVVLSTLPKGPESGPSQVIPALTSGRREQVIGGLNRRSIPVQTPVLSA